MEAIADAVSLADASAAVLSLVGTVMVLLAVMIGVRKLVKTVNRV